MEVCRSETSMGGPTQRGNPDPSRRSGKGRLALPSAYFRSAEVFMHFSGAWTELMPSQFTVRVVPSTE